MAICQPPQEAKEASLLVGKPILYGDIAPAYSLAYKKVSKLGKGDLLLIIGTSYFTGIARELKELAKRNGADIHEINEGAARNVERFLKENFEKYNS